MIHIPELITFFRSGFPKLLAFSAAFSFFIICNAQPVNIKVNIKGLKNDTVYITYPLGGPSITVQADTTVLKSGKGRFVSDIKFHPGLYSFVTGGKKYDFIMPLNNQNFSVSFDTVNYLKSVRAKGSKENTGLFDYMRFMSEKRIMLYDLENKSDDTDSLIRKKALIELTKLYDEVDKYRDKILTANDGNTLGKFLKAYSDIEIPDSPAGEADSLYEYNYYRTHFFDNADYANPELARMPVLEGKINEYISSVMSLLPDTAILETDRMLTRASAHPENFRITLNTLFNTYIQSQMIVSENVWVHIAEKWVIPYAGWYSPEYINSLKEEVTLRENSLIGKIAKPFNATLIPTEHFVAADADSTIKEDLLAGNPISVLPLLDGKINILYFWEPNCGHCRLVTPDLYRIYRKFSPLGLRVVAVQTNNTAQGKADWIDFVNENKLYNWPNIWSPDDYQYKLDYNVSSTPRIYIIEHGSHRILIKNIGMEQLEDIITNNITL